MATRTSQGENETPGYYETLHSVPEAMADLLSSYSGIAKDDQVAHITKLRNDAYTQFPYPCLGTFRFLDLDLARHFAYKEHVLAPLSRPVAPGEPEPLFLDCGCCLGQDVRKLIVDGVLPNRLWASDINPKFIEVGFELFRDGDRLPRDHFLCPGNVLASADDHPEDQLKILDNRVTVLGIAAVFHLFDLDEHRRIADRCLRLLRKDTGAPVVVVGRQLGSREPARVPRRRVGGHRYQHNEQSWEALWREVCGQPQWRDKVAGLEVKSKLSSRTRNEAPDAQQIIALAETDTDVKKRMLHMFTVSVTFKSDS